VFGTGFERRRSQERGTLFRLSRACASGTLTLPLFLKKCYILSKILRLLLLTLFQHILCLHLLAEQNLVDTEVDLKVGKDGVEHAKRG
jgi:hypothetical protein